MKKVVQILLFFLILAGVSCTNQEQKTRKIELRAEKELQELSAAVLANNMDSVWLVSRQSSDIHYLIFYNGHVVFWSDNSLTSPNIYSPREGTPAAKFEDRIEDELCHERFDRLVEVMDGISLEKNKEYMGRVVEVLVDGPSKNSPNTYSGRTDGFKLVNFTSDMSEDEISGQIVKVEITETKTFSLEGREC